MIAFLLGWCQDLGPTCDVLATDVSVPSPGLSINNGSSPSRAEPGQEGTERNAQANLQYLH